MGASSTSYLLLSWSTDGIAPSETSPPHLDIMGRVLLTTTAANHCSCLFSTYKLGPPTLSSSQSTQNRTSTLLEKAAVVQVIPRGYSQPHAFCFCLPKEPIASQASLVLQSYSSQGKSWSCSGSPLALRKKNEEKHHCHQQSCCAQPKSMESSSSGNLWGLYIALISFNLIHCLSSGEAILFLHYVQQGCVCRKHWRPTSCTTSPNKKNSLKY